jgi:predicted ATPase
MPMIISRVEIKKFRKFNDIQFNLGKKITIIAGQNGTMKSTLLGLIGHPFSLNDKENLMNNAKTIDGYDFGSKFTDKFNFSTSYEKAGEHQYTLYFTSDDIYNGKNCYNAKSINRSAGGKIIGLRIWSAAGNEKNMAYVQIPVIFLSLKRLVPIGEERVKAGNFELNDDEMKLVKKYHSKILLLNEEVLNGEHVKSSNKSTIGFKTRLYDPRTNSAGQDNVGKILLSVLSFKRLMEDYPNEYKGGLLLIDEIDATMFPRAQEELIESLVYFSGKYKIQIICTTHSVSAMKAIMAEKYSFGGDRSVLYLRNRENKILVNANDDLDLMLADLKVIPKPGPKKIRLYCEDSEAFIFISGLIPKSSKLLIMMMDKVSLGAENYLELVRKKIPEFCYNIIALDGDQKNKIKNMANNICVLPGDELSPEELFFDFLKNLSDEDDFWDQEQNYTKQVCLGQYCGENRPNNRVEFKKWFNAQSNYWGDRCMKLINRWKQDNARKVEIFLKQFNSAFEYAKKNMTLSR